MRNVGAQTQKKWGPGGPPPEGWGPEGWGPEEWRPEGLGAQRGGGPDLEKVSAPRVGALKGGGSQRGGPKGGGPKFRVLFSLSRQHFISFLSLSRGSLRGILVVFEAPGPSNVHVWSSRAVV